MKLNKDQIPDSKIDEHLKQTEQIYRKERGEVLGLSGNELDSVLVEVHGDEDLDTRTKVVRQRESNSGNLVADALRSHFGADVGIINGGFIRGDRVYKRGRKITKGDILEEFPFPKVAVPIRIRAGDLICALEQHLALTPAATSTFPHVSGLRIVFDPEGEVGNKIKQIFWVREKDEEEKTEASKPSKSPTTPVPSPSPSPSASPSATGGGVGRHLIPLDDPDKELLLGD
eukprot:TRINITY_DN7410_c0_g6_i2.p1 TRINITY_DN7410_c0_g6~~TRINITY_DN7410_c0_g6_i2.p1  ORF type:complete len:230 (-),score=42.87 TRINITY_DN7410_c0_g6_i2:203-892(-)